MVGQRCIWMIENFSCLKFQMFEDFGGVNVYIDPFHSSEYISVQVISNSYSNISIALLDSEGSPLLWRERKYSTRNIFKFHDIKRGTIFGSMRTKFLPNDTLRLQCIWWDTREDLIDPPSYFVCSRIEPHTEVIEKTFSWKIASISSLKADQTREQVELFKSEGDAMLATNTGDVLKIRLFLGTSLKVKLSATLGTAHVKCLISVLDVMGKIIQFADEEYNFTTKNEVWTIDIPISKDMLEYYRKEFLPNHALSLVFDCTFSHNTIRNRCIVGEDDIFVKKSLPNVTLPLTSAPSTRSDESENKQQSLPNNNISQALMGILEEGFMSDFSFRFQNKTFPVHKIILGARSSVFRAMFTADMKEKDSSSVDIPDVEADTFQRMLDFVYSDTFEDDMQWESASKLYSVADKYALEPLKQKCSRLLKTGLSVSSVLDVLLLGDAHQDDDLKAAALDFVARNDKKIIGTERWDRFVEAHPMLALHAFQKLYEKKMDA